MSKSDEPGERPNPAAAPEGLPPLPAFPGQEEDVLFKAQMAVAQAFYGYWKHALAMVGLLLVGVFLWGTWQNRQVESLQASHAEIEVVMRTLRAGLRAHADNPEMLKAQAAEGGRRLAEIGARTDGPGGTYAWIQAARVYQAAEDPEKVLEAWQKAHARGDDGPMGWAAASGLSGALFEQGKVDEAVAVLQGYGKKGKGYAVERSLFDAARLLELAGRRQEAAAAFEAFQSAHPTSPLASMAASAASRLKETG